MKQWAARSKSRSIRLFLKRPNAWQQQLRSTRLWVRKFHEQILFFYRLVNAFCKIIFIPTRIVLCPYPYTYGNVCLFLPALSTTSCNLIFLSLFFSSSMSLHRSILGCLASLAFLVIPRDQHLSLFSNNN